MNNLKLFFPRFSPLLTLSLPREEINFWLRITKVERKKSRRRKIMNDTTREMNFIYKVFLSLSLTLLSRVIWLKIFMGRWFITLHTAWRHQIASILRCCCCRCCSFLLHYIKLFAIFLRRFFPFSRRVRCVFMSLTL